MTSTVNVGLAIPQRFLTEEIDTSGLRSYVTTAETLGYDGLWTVEQSVNASYDLAPIPLLSFAAALTTRIRLGTCVLVSLLHNPINLAKSLATLDRISNGRVVLGIGTGSRHVLPHLSIFGVAPDTRAAQFEEGLVLMKQLWTGERVTFNGRFWQMSDVFISPQPVQKPSIPIWFGGHAHVALRRAARLGDGWIGASSTSTVAFKNQLADLRRYLDDEHRDPAQFALAKRVFVAVARDRETALSRLKPWFAVHGGGIERAKQLAVYGSRDDCLEGLADIASTGVGTIVLAPVFEVQEQAERLAREVLPHL